MRERWWILAVVSSALLLIVIDMTVLYTALPRLTHDLHATASEKLWIINAYGLVVSGLLLGAGALGDRLGHKRLFCWGLVVFGCASLFAAFSPSASTLIGARALLAIGAAMMMPSTLSIIRLVFEDDGERALAIGIWAAVASGGAALGPIVGGLLLEYFWWGSVFLINVPIVVVAWLLAWRLIPSLPGDLSRRWDWKGSLLVMIGLIGLAHGIKSLAQPSPSLVSVLLALGVGAVCLAWFVRAQRRQADPMLDLSLFRMPLFNCAVIAALVAAAGLVGMELMFTQRLQLVLDYSPLQAAMYLLPLPLASFVSGPLAGRLLPAVGGLRLLVWAQLICAAGLGGYIWSLGLPVWVQQVWLLVLGAGLGATMTAASHSIMMGAPPERAGVAASVEEVSYELGGAIGITLFGTVASALYSLTLHLPQGVPESVQVRDSLDEALAVAESLPAELAAVVLEQARLAFDNGYFATLAMSVLMYLLAGAYAWYRYKGLSRLSAGGLGKSR